VVSLDINDPASILGGIYGDGIISAQGAYDLELIDRVNESIMSLFVEAQSVEKGALPRGPQRWYVEVAPEKINGFIEIVSHPWFKTVCEAVLGPQWKIVEVGFDIPFPGAMDQPWHRDFRAPIETIEGRLINSLAFNLTAVDTTEDMGPFEIAPGTQWDLIPECPMGMFPDPARWPRYTQRAVRKLTQRGTISARSALTIHRGTANVSKLPRPVLVIGVDGPSGTNATHHDLQMTPHFLAQLPIDLHKHCPGRIVDQIEVIRQNHVIDGLIAPTSPAY
jgi:hypothetical protein